MVTIEWHFWFFVLVFWKSHCALMCRLGLLPFLINVIEWGYGWWTFVFFFWDGWTSNITSKSHNNLKWPVFLCGHLKDKLYKIRFLLFYILNVKNNRFCLILHGITFKLLKIFEFLFFFVFLNMLTINSNQVTMGHIFFVFLFKDKSPTTPNTNDKQNQQWNIPNFVSTFQPCLWKDQRLKPIFF